jgi:hypothetical protein
MKEAEGGECWSTEFFVEKSARQVVIFTESCSLSEPTEPPQGAHAWGRHGPPLPRQITTETPDTPIRDPPTEKTVNHPEAFSSHRHKIVQPRSLFPVLRGLKILIQERVGEQDLPQLGRAKTCFTVFPIGVLVTQRDKDGDLWLTES